MSIAEVALVCGKFSLSVVGVTVATEGDPCRGNPLLGSCLEPISEREMAEGSIDGIPVSEFPIAEVRLFREGRWTEKILRRVKVRDERWTEKLLRCVADRINGRPSDTEERKDDLQASK